MKRIGALLVFLLITLAGYGALADEANTGTVTGRLMIKAGEPLSHGVVYFFNEASGPPPSRDRYWRVPDEIVTADGEGNFTAKLVAGQYYVGAIKKKSGQEIGPPQEGDLFLPMFSSQKGPRLLTVVSGKTTDLGVITGAKPFHRGVAEPGKKGTTIEGKITDVRGRPVKGALVFAFLTPAMVGKPLYVSDRTGKDGKFRLSVSEGGVYYLKVRNTYGGGALKAGEILGSYGQEKPLPVNVKTGETVKGITITGIRFPGRGQKKR